MLSTAGYLQHLGARSVQSHSKSQRFLDLSQRPRRQISQLSDEQVFVRRFAGSDTLCIGSAASIEERQSWQFHFISATAILASYRDIDRQSPRPVSIVAGKNDYRTTFRGISKIR